MLILVATMMLQAAAPPPPAKPALKCRRHVETGSLARVQKICHTVEEWRVIDGNGREATAALQRPGVSPSANN